MSDKEKIRRLERQVDNHQQAIGLLVAALSVQLGGATVAMIMDVAHGDTSDNRASKGEGNELA